MGAHPDLKCYLRPSLSDRVSALIKIKPANQYKNQVENQETFVPPHPAVISREKQKNKKRRRRPITPKEMNKITTVSFLHTVHTQILKPSGQESLSILIYKRKKELKKYKNFYNLKKKKKKKKKKNFLTQKKKKKKKKKKK